MMVTTTGRTNNGKWVYSRKGSCYSSGNLANVLFCLLVSCLIFPMTSNAMTASPHAFTVRQLNETIALKINGDEFSHWISDVNDYTVVQDDSGFYTYAKLGDDGKLVPSDEKVGKPPSKSVKKYLRPPGSTENSQLDGTSTNDVNTISNHHGPRRDRRSLRGSTKKPLTDQNHRRTATVGTLKNLVVLIRFRDHGRRAVPTKDEIDILMNSEEAHPLYAPTGSLKMVYWENSYGQLTIESFVADWITVRQREAYYAARESGVGTNRIFQEALVEVLDKMENQNFDFSEFDQDNDSHIDSITFMTSGYGAEWGGAGFEDRIWSHQWNIDWRSAKTGVRVTKYHVSPSLWGTSGNLIGRVGVIAHETGHFLGLDDHYDVDYSGNGLGFFCLMANSWGYDGSQLYPPHMSAYSKMKLQWVNPETPTIGMNVVARSETPKFSAAPNHLYKIGDGQFGYPLGEYLLIEYRKTEWLRGGIAIYHVDETAPYDNEGFPGQVAWNGVGWPYNGNHYKIALVAADSEYELERGINQGNSFDLYSAGQYIVPYSVMLGNKRFPNTDTYQYGSVEETGVEIYVLSEPNRDLMSFVFWDGEARGWTWLSKYFVKEPEVNSAPSPTTPPIPGPTEDTSRWRTIVSENFDGGPGLFVLGSDAEMEDKKCLSNGNCVKISKDKDTSTIRIQVDVSFLSDLEISFDFFADGLKDGEAIRLEHSSTNSNDWRLARSWVMGEGTFVDKVWTSTAAIWTMSESHGASLQLRFRTTSEKKGFYIDNIVIRGR